ncbi:MAG: polysaccharide biosynthesis protein [Thermoleophilia bacterium]|nr:polysaccharide biosynthesis protein [Thermoleophilia bacterium]
MTDSASIEADEARELAATTGIARDAGLGLLGRVVAMGCSAVTGLLVANALTKGEYGAYAIVVGINVVLVMALDLGLTSALARYAAQGRATTRLVSSVALTRLAVIAVAAGAVLATGELDSVAESRVGELLPWLALLVVTQSTISFHFGMLPSLRRIRLLLAVTVAQPVAELALVLRARSEGATPDAMLLATILAGAVVGTLAWLALLAPGRAASTDIPDAPRAEQAHLRMVATYGRSIFLVSLLIAVFGQVDQFVIGLFHPLAEVAPYALAIKLQALVAAPGITIAGIVAPRIAGAGSRALATYRQWLAFLLVVDLGAVLVLCALAPEVFGAIGDQYGGEWAILVAMAPFLLLSATAPLPSIALNQVGHAGARLRIAATALAINVALDLALVPGLGGYGAAIGTTVAYAYYFERHHRILERALIAPAPADARSIRRTIVVGVVVSLAVAAVAFGIRLALEAALDAPSDVLVVLVAGGVAGALHLAWSVRIVRTPVAARGRATIVGR